MVQDGKVVASGAGRELVQTGVNDRGEPIGFVRYDTGETGPVQLLLSYLVRGYWDTVV